MNYFAEIVFFPNHFQCFFYGVMDFLDFFSTLPCTALFHTAIFISMNIIWLPCSPIQVGRFLTTLLPSPSTLLCQVRKPNPIAAGYKPENRIYACSSSKDSNSARYPPAFLQYWRQKIWKSFKLLSITSVEFPQSNWYIEM